MAAGQFNKIEWSDYNAIQSVIAPVLGATPTASGNTGYGQAVASSQVTQYAKITNTQWGNLRTDILRARQHQTGTDLTSTLAVPYFEITITQTALNTNLLTTASTSQLAVNCPVIFIGASLLGGVQPNTTYYVKTIDSATTFTISSSPGGAVFGLSTAIASMTCRFGGTKISEADRAAYKAAADLAATNKLVGTTGDQTIPATQSFRETLYNDAYIVPWNGVLTLTTTVQFTSYDAARYFFNARGQIEFKISRTGGTGGEKNATWTTMLDIVSGMGIIYFTYNSVVNLLKSGNPGTGTPAAFGFYGLTTSNRLIFEKLAPSGAYADNKFRIYAKLIDGSGGAGSNSCIQFTIEWRDESSNPNPTTYGPYGPFGIDESVDGIMGSIIEVLRPGGNNVSLPAPSANIANNFIVSALASNVITYTITPDVSTTNEGTTITYNIVTTNLPNGSTVYWTNSGSTQAADFTDGVNTGSVTINNNTASFTRSIRNDALTEGPESVQIVLRTGNTAGPIVASSSVVSVNDTSLTPYIYSIVVDTGQSPFVVGPGTGQTTSDEGTTFTFTVTAQNFGNGTLYWTNAGTTTAADFTDNTNSGGIPIYQDGGSFTRTVSKDLLTEGTETIIIQLRTGNTNGTIVLTSNTINISDTSTTILPQYTISTSLFAIAGTEPVNEGDTFNVYVDTNSKVSSAAIYWNWTGIAAADLGLNVTYGAMPITPGSRSTQTFTVSADGLTEGTENAYLNFYSDSGLSTLLTSASVGGIVSGNSRTIKINDTSPNLAVSPALLSTPTSGSGYTTTFSASNGTGIYSYSCTSGKLPVGLSLDGLGNLSGTVIVAGSYSFTVTAKDSNNRLGSTAYAGSITANETISAPSRAEKNNRWYWRVDYGIANGSFTVNGTATYYLDARGTYWDFASFGGATGTATFNFVFAGSGTTRTVTIVSY